MSKSKVLVQLDPDPHASVFDAMVAVDAGVEHLLQYGGVDAARVTPLVHGAIFTRGSGDLRHTAIFVGGSDVAQSERLLQAICGSFFGPMRVSVMFDANGANTTAAAAVLSAANHVELQGAEALVLAATGPVGQRAVRLLAREGAVTRVASRTLARAEAVCRVVSGLTPAARLIPQAIASSEQLQAALSGVSIVISAGAAGIQLLSAADRRRASHLKVAIDLNAVPPLGIEGIKASDQGALRDDVHSYGAIGVGGLKMKIHKASLRKLFETNDQVLDAEQIFAIGKELVKSSTA
jgi:hypothetical protein